MKKANAESADELGNIKYDHLFKAQANCHQETVALMHDTAEVSQAPRTMIKYYMKNHMVDAHLSVVQTCRVCLAGFGLVAFCAAVGAGDPRGRLQCALTSSACFLSTIYYSRLYTLRRLPVSLGYSFESNTVAESMRYTNWTIVIALLGVCAFLLRGPFDRPLVGPFTWWQWPYSTWKLAGPLISSAGTIVSLPGWHASRTARSYQLQGARRKACMWLLICSLFLTISAGSSLLTASIMLQPLQTDPPARTENEIILGRSISALWFVYPMVSFARTVAIILGAGDWGAEVVGAQRSVETYKDRLQHERSRMSSLLYTAVDGFFVFLKNTYLAFVASPECKNTIAVVRLSAMADGIIAPNALEDTDMTANRVPLISNRVQAKCGDLRLKNAKEMQEDIYSVSNMTVHLPEVTPLCAQGVDSTIAIVDIFSQAISALACAALTLPST